ncbi:MAG: hypothetical protein ABIO70_36030 [Pseudomonadota bacterium]
MAAPAAWAHSPHDVAKWVAVSPGPEPAWIVTSLVRFDAWMVTRTHDGEVIETRYLLPDTEDVATAALLGPERLFLGTGGLGLWASEDAGDSFRVHLDLPADATVHKIALSPDFAADGIALAAGFVPGEGGAHDGRIWRTTDAGERWELAQALDGLALLDLDFSPDFPEDGRAFALTRDGRVVGSDDGGRSWSQVATLDNELWQVAVGEGARVWAATRDDGLWRSDDDGARFSCVAFEGEAVSTVIDLGGDLVLATLPTEAVWRSEDGGERWTYQHDLIQPAGGGVGNPTDGNHYYDFFEDDTDTIWLASWEGITRSTDRGLTWRAIETYRPEALRGVSVSVRADTGDPVVVLASNGGGMQWVDPRAGLAAPIGFALPRPWPRMVHAAPSWGEATPVFTTLSNGLAGTFDGGRSWSSLALEALGGAEDVYLPLDFDAVPHVLAVGLAQGGAGWALSTDGGHTWRAGQAPLEEEATCNVAAFSDGYAEDGLAWIACGSHGEVFVTDDEGATWSAVGAAGARIEGMAGSPGGEALFLATLDGLRVSQAGGAPERLAFRGEPVWDVVISPGWPADPTVFALAAASGWFRSDDGGQSWIELARPTGDVFQNLAISPNFAEDGAVAAAGFSGAWVSLDRGETWQDIHAVEIVDTRHPYWRLSNGWAMVPDERSVNLEFAQAITPGEVATGSFYGVGLALLGPPGLDAKGSLSVRLDGQGEGTVDLRDFRGDGRPELFSAWDLDEGWHTLEITAEDGTVVFDAVEVQRLPFTLTSFEEEAGGCRGRCQVASGAGSGAWLPPLVLVVWRSRRRARGRSAPG